MSDSDSSVIKEHQTKGQTLVVTLAGDIDLQHSVQFQQEIAELMCQGFKSLIFDLTDVPYMDSSGVASLVKVLSSCKRKNMELILAGMNPRVKGIFEITRLDKVFRMSETVAEAMEQI